MKKEISLPKGVTAKMYQDGDKIVIEYEERFITKRGDFVAHTDDVRDTLITIFNEKRGSQMHYFAGIVLPSCQQITFNDWCSEKWIERLATDTERQQLLDSLHAAGKDWDAEKMEIFDLVWSPKIGEVYYIANIYFEQKYVGLTWCGDPDDVYLKKVGLVFRTKEEAIACTKRMLKSAKI